MSPWRDRLDAVGGRAAARLTSGGQPLAWTLRGYRRSSLRTDAIGGVTVAALIVPLSIGYAQVAGLPPEVGLYASMVPLLAYAVFGSARRLIVGPDAATAALVAAAIVPLAVGSDDRVRLASALALIVAAIFIAMRLATLGFLADFLSRPILVGYMTGVGITVAINQIPKILGGKPLADALAVVGGVELAKVDLGVLVGSIAIALEGGEVNIPSVIVGGLVLAAVLVGDRLLPGIPVALLALVASLVASVALDLAARGVQVLGPVPSGLPPIGIPFVSLDEAVALLPGAIGIAILSFADTSLTGRNFADRHGEVTDPNRELLALGAADLGASLTSGYPISSSASRTAALESSGATTQMAGVIAAGAVALVLVFLAGYLTNLPVPALGAVVLTSALRFIDIRGIARIWRAARVEGAIAIVATLGVILYGTLYGVAIAALLAAVNVFRRAAQPRIDELGRLPDSTIFADLTRDPTARRVPGVLVVRYAGPLFFATASAFRARVREMLEARPDVRRVVIDAPGIVDLDLTAAEAIRALERDLASRDVTLTMARTTGKLRDLLRGFGLTELAGPPGAAPRTLDEAVEAAGAIAPETSVPLPTDSLDVSADVLPPGAPGSARHWPAAVVVLAAIAVASILIAALAVGGANDQPPAGDVTVPNIVGMSLDRAASAVDDQGLVLGDVTYITTTALPEGTVTAQSPQAGAVVPAGDAVSPTVSTRRDLVTIPDVAGDTAAQAVVTLTTAGLRVGATRAVEDPTVAEGLVVGTVPAAGRRVAANTVVELLVAAAPSAPASPVASPVP
jgi:high affinity sulfate transporter 1